MISTPPKLTIKQFFREYADVDGRHELVDGEVVGRTGATVRQAYVAGNLHTSLGTRLRRTGCWWFNSQMGIKTGPVTVRYPDAAIYCDPRDLERDAEAQALEFPKVIFEVLSPSVGAFRMLEYKALPSVQTIVIVDPIAQFIEVHRRAGPAA